MADWIFAARGALSIRRPEMQEGYRLLLRDAPVPCCGAIAAFEALHGT